MVQSWRKRFNLLPILLILPTLYFVYLFTVRPTYHVLKDSQTYYHAFRPDRMRPTDLQLPGIEEMPRSLRGPHDVGWAYFRAMLDPATPEGKVFQQTFKNTIVYVAATVPISMALAFFFAVLINQRLKGIGIARAALFYPTLMPMVSAATVWLFFFTPDYGLWNTALKFFGYAGSENWVVNPKLGLFSLIIVAIWKNAGYFMIFYLAGMQNLPSEIYEAADMDGASWFVKTTKITFPLLRRTTLFVSVIAIIGAFQNIDHALVLTRQLVSGEADLLLYEIYQQRFDLGNYGFSNSLTVVMIGLLLMLTMANFLISERNDA